MNKHPYTDMAMSLAKSMYNKQRSIRDMKVEIKQLIKEGKYKEARLLDKEISNMKRGFKEGKMKIIEFYSVEQDGFKPTINFENEFDAVSFGIGKGEWGTNSTPKREEVVIYDSLEEYDKSVAKDELNRFKEELKQKKLTLEQIQYIKDNM